MTSSVVRPSTFSRYGTAEIASTSAFRGLSFAAPLVVEPRGGRRLPFGARPCEALARPYRHLRPRPSDRVSLVGASRTLAIVVLLRLRRLLVSLLVPRRGAPARATVHRRAPGSFPQRRLLRRRRRPVQPPRRATGERNEVPARPRPLSRWTFEERHRPPRTVQPSTAVASASPATPRAPRGRTARTPPAARVRGRSPRSSGAPPQSREEAQQGARRSPAPYRAPTVAERLPGSWSLPRPARGRVTGRCPQPHVEGEEGASWSTARWSCGRRSLRHLHQRQKLRRANSVSRAIVEPAHASPRMPAQRAPASVCALGQRSYDPAHAHQRARSASFSAVTRSNSPRPAPSAGANVRSTSATSCERSTSAV